MFGVAPGMIVAYTALQASAAATGAPSGAGIAVAAVGASACVVCMAEPISWFRSEGKYNEAAATIVQEKAGLMPLQDAVAGAWSGDSMKAYESYFNNRVVPAIDGLHSVITSLGSIMQSGGWAQVSFILGMISATVAAVAAFVAIAVAAAATGPAAPATIQAQWAPASAWIAFALAGAGAIAALMKAIHSAISTLKNTQMPALQGVTEVIDSVDPLAQPALSNLDHVQTLEDAIEEYKVD